MPRGRHEVVSSHVQASRAAQPALWRSFVSANSVIGTYECSRFRTEFAADSPLEESGFEPSVPPCERVGLKQECECEPGDKDGLERVSM